MGESSDDGESFEDEKRLAAGIKAVGERYDDALRAQRAWFRGAVKRAAELFEDELVQTIVKFKKRLADLADRHAEEVRAATASLDG